MSNTAGQLGFLFPAIAVPLTFYFMKDKSVYLLWLLVISLLAFGIINEKRATIFILPLLIYFCLLVNNESTNITRSLIAKNLVIGFLILIISVTFGAIFIPSLNPSESYYGSVDFLHIVRYAFDYLTMDYGTQLQGQYKDAFDDKSIQVGRLTLLMYLSDWLSNASLQVKLFGVGFGIATSNQWSVGPSDPLFNFIGARGAISGAGLTLIETGIIGLLIFIFFFTNIFLKIKQLLRHEVNPNTRRWYRTVELLFWVFLFDFFFYSTILFRTMPLPIIFFTIISTLTILEQARNQSLTFIKS
jgi:hypothetical protein